PSENFRQLDIPGLKSPGNYIISFAKVDAALYILTSNARIVKVGLPDLNIIKELPLADRHEKIYDLIRKGNKYIMLSSNGILQYDTMFRFLAEYRPGIFVKAVERSNNMFVVATSVNVIRFDVNTCRVTDTIWKGRSTAVHVLKGTTYVGTLH